MIQGLTTKEYLQQIHMIRAKVERLESVRAILRSDLYSVHSAVESLGRVRVQSSFSDSRVNRILCKIETIDGMILEEIDRLQGIRQTIVGQIEAIPDERMKEILFRRYVKCEKWEYIAGDIYADIRYVYRVHSQALKAFSQMFGTALPDGSDDAGGSNHLDGLKSDAGHLTVREP